jgi:hypothetical protein
MNKINKQEPHPLLLLKHKNGDKAFRNRSEEIE